MPLGAARPAVTRSVALGPTGIGLGVAVFAHLVLEGGGVKGIALVGAISVLPERGYQFRRVAGTSAGAIVGSLVAANVGAAELEEIMRGVDYRRFQDGPRWKDLFIGKVAALMFQQGIYEGQFVKDWLGEKLAGLGVRTFADLRYEDSERPPDPECAYRLVVMACDISQGCLRRLPWEYGDHGLSHADQPVAGAVRASVSIPFFYRPARLTGADWYTQDLLFRQGRDAAVRFLDGAPGQAAWDWETYKRIHRNSPSPAASAARPAFDALRSVRHRLHRRAQHGYRTATGPAATLRSATPQ